MQKRHWISVVGAVTTICSLALGWDPIDKPYGDPGCPPYDSPETQGSNGGPTPGGSMSGGKLSDPINLATGDFQLSQVDLTIPGRGLDFEIKRFYRSISGLQAALRIVEDVPRDLLGYLPVTPMGDHWHFNYDMRMSFPEPEFTTIDLNDPTLIIDPTQWEPSEILPDRLSVVGSTGRVDAYVNYETVPDQSDPDITYGHYANDHFARKLIYTAADEPIYLYESDMTVYEFFPAYSSVVTNTDSTSTQLPYAGRLKSITDRNGNRILFSWETANGVERLGAAVDTLLHPINIVYHNEQYNGVWSDLAGDYASPGTSSVLSQLIWKVIDHAGREVEYDYQVDSDVEVISSVTLPAIESDSHFSLPTEHERFPDGRVWNYEYDDGTINFWGGRLLKKMTSPNGDVVLENDYNLYGEQEHPNTLRVLTQKYGNYEYNYILTDLSGNVIFQSTNLDMQQDYYVWVNDRRGAITRLKYRGESSSTPGFYRQLLEETVYEGFVTDPKKSTWASVDQNGNPTSWHYLDDSSNYANYDTPISHNGPGGVTSPVSYTQTYDTNDNWNVTGFFFPEDGSSNSDSITTDFADSVSDPTNPLQWGAKKKRTQHEGGSSATIIEEWDYSRFSIGGCGCGSNGFETGYKDGNGNYTLKEYDDVVNTITGRPSGDLLAVYHDVDSGSFSTPYSQAEADAAAVEKFEYNDWGQVTKHTHPKKFILDSGGGEYEHQQVDRFIYYPLTAHPNNAGRLKQVIIDDTDDNSTTTSNFQITTTYEYDAIGNVVKETHPDGDISEYLYNQASQLIQHARYDHGGSSGKPFEQVDYFYDANGNMVRKEVANLDANRDPVSGNSTITTVYEYNIHDLLVVESREAEVFDGTIAESTEHSGVGRKAVAPITNSTFASRELEYDGGDNLVMYYDGEAVNGADSTNVTKYEYNSRDLLVKETAGFGGASPLVKEALYDEKGRIQEAITNPGGSQAQTYHIDYDGFDRITSYSDPMGNEFHFEYDNNNNVTRKYACGPLDEDSTTSLESGDTLFNQVLEYDRHDRMVKQETDIYSYDYDAGSGPSCGTVPSGTTQHTLELVYNDDSSIKERILPSGDSTVDDITTFYYDTASRLVSILDAAGNESFHTYDIESNLLQVLSTDFSDIVGASFEQYKINYEYDVLDRRVATIDGVGNRSETKYDSRGNPVELKDPRGNITQQIFDGMNRLTQTSVVMTDSGEGAGNVVSVIETYTRYDDSNRVYEEEDDNGSITKYEYDGMNRITKLIMPDNTDYETTYDDTGNVHTYTDARGVTITNTHDRNNRLVSRSMSGTVVAGSTFESYTYDGLGRLRTASNDFAEITRQYDSRSNIVREIQNADADGGFQGIYDRVIEYSHDDANNMNQIVYPSGRTIDRTFDKLNRLASILDPAMLNPSITEFKYIGNRLQRRVHGNGTETNYSYDGYESFSGITGDHGFGRVVGITTTKGASTLDDFAFTWDKSQNRTSYNDVGSGMKNRRERAFSYDSSNRLVSTDVDFPEVGTDYTAPTNAGVTDYALDGVHNRFSVTGFEGAGAPIGDFKNTSVDDPDHVKNNQYTYTAHENGGSWINTYDVNGNLTFRAEHNVSDFTGDYELDFFDQSQFLQAHGNEDPSADLNNDGDWDFFDISIFLADFTNGAHLDHQYFTYDFRNQLVSVELKSGNDTLVSVVNTYDPFARRIIETVGESPDTVSYQYVYGCSSLWEVIEKIQLETAISLEKVLLTHVYGLGIDDEVAYRVEDTTTPEDYWSHRDDLNSLTSVTDDLGTVKERYEYGDYGKPTIFNPDTGEERSASSIGATHLYTGRSLIMGTGLYDYRHRVMDPETGKFRQRDPLGYIDSMNMYTYVVSNPASYVDAYGLSIWDFIPFVRLVRKFVYPNPPGTLVTDYTGLGVNLDDCEGASEYEKDIMYQACATRMLQAGLNYQGDLMWPLLFDGIFAAIGGAGMYFCPPLGGALLAESFIDGALTVRNIFRVANAASSATVNMCGCNR